MKAFELNLDLQMIELILFRHAKTRPAGPSEDDHERALTPRGWDDAPRVARALWMINSSPDLILLSDARRCRETREAMQEVFDEVETEILPSLYLADAERVMRTANEAALTTRARSIMVIAHNPGLQDLATELAPGSAEDEVRMRFSFPTAAAACFRRSDEHDRWSLKNFFTPKSLRPGDSPTE